MESELTDALATSARAMPRLRSGPHHLHRKDVPHLSESLLIGIERWRFVEGFVNEFARLMNRCFVLDRKRLSAREARHLRSCFVPPQRARVSHWPARVARCRSRRAKAKALPLPAAGQLRPARAVPARARANS